MSDDRSWALPMVAVFGLLLMSLMGLSVYENGERDGRIAQKREDKLTWAGWAGASDQSMSGPECNAKWVRDDFGTSVWWYWVRDDDGLALGSVHRRKDEKIWSACGEITTICPGSYVSLASAEAAIQSDHYVISDCQR